MDGGNGTYPEVPERGPDHPTVRKRNGLTKEGAEALNQRLKEYTGCQNHKLWTGVNRTSGMFYTDYSPVWYVFLWFDQNVESSVIVARDLIKNFPEFQNPDVLEFSPNDQELAKTMNFDVPGFKT